MSFQMYQQPPTPCAKIGNPYNFEDVRKYIFAFYDGCQYNQYIYLNKYAFQ